MRKGLLLIIVLAITSGMALAVPGMAAESVRILSSLDGQTAHFQVQASGSANDNLTVGIPAIALSTVELNSREYKKVDLPGADKLNQAELAEDGKPAVPALTTMLIIPDQSGVRLTTTYSTYDDIEDIDLAPVQPSTSDSDPGAVIPFTMNQDTYNSDSFYPGQLAEAAEPAIMRDVRLVQITLYPVQYNPVKRTLRVYHDLSVSISYDGEVVNPKEVRRPFISDGFYPIYKSMFANFDQVFGTAVVKRGGYVIICKPVLADSLKALALWKHKKGYSVTIIKTTDITPGGSPTYTQIQSYLRTAYQTWDVPPEYVMLAGDVSGTYGIPYYPYSSYPSDHGYACVEGSDYLPELFVARLSTNNIVDFRKAVAKIFKYEETPLMRDPQHWIRGLSIGYTYIESTRLITLYARHLMLENGFARVDTVYGTSRNQAVFNYLNTGPNLIQYRGAGGTDGWWGPECYIPDLNALQTTNKLGVMAILTCGTGDFGGECLGETWIRMGLSVDSLKGGPGYYGVSDHFTNTRWNNPIMVGYYFGIFSENIYHFAAAAVRGKLQDYYAFPSQRNGEVRKYFNTYNMLGDPELELRTKIPIILNVTNPETLAFGLNHIDVGVVDSAGNAIQDAFVTLIKMVDTTEECYSIGKTDAAGNVSLSFDAQTPGGMFLTVSGRNLYPYEDTVWVAASDVAVGADSFFIDDDNYGYSQGNSDSLANPGETIELGVSFKNYGTALTASNITATLSAIDESGVEIFEGTRSIGSLAPGESRMAESPFVIHLSADDQDGDIIRLKQTVTDQDNQTWFSEIDIPVKAPQFIIKRIAVIDDNNRLDPGDTVNIVMMLKNRGEGAALGVTATISTEDDYATILDNFGSFGDIPAGDSVYNVMDSMTIAVDAAAFSGRRVKFALHTSTSSGEVEDIPFTVPVDSILTGSDPTGPDAYGYYMFDKNDTLYSPHPHYNWVEIVPGLGGSGSRLSYGAETDDKSVLVNLPFDLVYYGQHYGAIIVCTNGFISPDTSRIDMGGNFWAYFYNWSIPDPGNCHAQISPFWDDLSFSGTTYGVYTWSDTTNHRFVIEWYHMVNNYNLTTVETFETIIYDPAYYPTLTGDSDLLYQYNTINNVDADQNYAAVGIESWDELTGIQYTNDNTYSPGASTLANGMAILVTTNTGRGGIKGTVTLDGAADNSGARVAASSGQYRITDAIGAYWLRDVPPGVISLKAEASGYFPEFRDSVTIPTNSFVAGIDDTLYGCPVPTNLAASDSFDLDIHLNWDAISDSRLAGYNIYRSRFEAGGYAKLNAAPISSPSYSDVPGDTSIYWYKVSAVYAASGWETESFLSAQDSGRQRQITGISGDGTALPKQFFLAQNYPNPFNPTTVISYGLPKNADVKIDVFNLLGQRVLTLVDGRQQAGFKSVIWDGKDGAGNAVASGVYFYKIDAGSFKDSRKMIMLK